MITASLLEKLKDEAVKILRCNDLGHATKPAPHLYPHQWNWDSAFIAIGLSHIDPDRARQEILSLIRGQWTNGKIPHMLFTPGDSEYHPNAAFWATNHLPESPDTIQTSGITQPPIIAVAALALYNNSNDKKAAFNFLQAIYPNLKKNIEFFRFYRDLERDGLTYIIHPWESGMDNSPRWDRAMQNIEMKWQPQYKRVDTTLIDKKQRPSNEEYDRYTYLVEFFRQAKYETSTIRKNCPFLIQPIMFNSLLFASLQALQKIEKILNEDTTDIDSLCQNMEKAVNKKLWDSGLKRYVDFDLRLNKAIANNTVASYVPLYAKLASQERAELLIDSLFSRQHFWPKNGYPLCSVAMSEPGFNPARYWRGPVWINMNWLLIHGLAYYSFKDKAFELLEKSIELVANYGFYEYFNPLTGEGYGSDNFSWTASLIIDMIEKYQGNEVFDKLTDV